MEGIEPHNDGNFIRNIEQHQEPILQRLPSIRRFYELHTRFGYRIIHFIWISRNSSGQNVAEALAESLPALTSGLKLIPVAAYNNWLNALWCLNAIASLTLRQTCALKPFGVLRSSSQSLLIFRSLARFSLNRTKKRQTLDNIDLPVYSTCLCIQANHTTCVPPYALAKIFAH